MKTLAIYLMAMPDTPELAAAAVDAGADLIEIGFPFSDPLADGPVIRRAGERALAAGMRTARCLEVLAQIRGRVDVPLVPMTYASIFDAYGWERLEADARSAGATSFIVPDLAHGMGHVIACKDDPNIDALEINVANSPEIRFGYRRTGLSA